MADELPDELRRLLADARHTDPIPVDVAARLDDVLARLAEGEAPDGEVVDLAGRRRRRRAVQLLGAAAAVILVGTTAAQFLDVGGAGDSASSQVAADAAVAGAEAPDTSGDSGRAEQGADGGATAMTPEAAPQAGSAPSDELMATSTAVGELVGGVPARFTRLDTAGFSEQVAALQSRVSGVRALTYDRVDGGTSAKQLDGCEPADWGQGAAVAVTYDGEPAVLVFRPPTGSTQVVDLLQCGTADVLRSTTVRVP